jgi:hypothetical protein
MCEGCSTGPSPKMDRRNFLRLGGAGLAGAVLLGTAGGKVLAQAGPSLDEEFRSAASEYGVPRELLKAMGHVNTLWEMPSPTVTDYEPGDLHGRGAYGIMQLYQNPSSDTLSRAASLTGLSEEDLKNARSANVRGGAAVLSDIAGPAKPDDLGGWQEAVAEYGGIDLYAQEVFQTLKNGASATISTGESLRLTPRDVEVPTVVTARVRADYPRATWVGTNGNNFTGSNRGRSAISKIVIHIAEGSVSSAVNWFKNPDANASAHYIVGDEGRVVQCVRDENIAWHAANWTYNKRSIGIEHGGYASNSKAWTDAKYRASAKLAAYCCRKYGIPVDNNHFVLHRDVPGVNKTCPGYYFRLGKYKNLVQRFK